MQKEYVESIFNLKWFSTSMDKHAPRVRVLNAHLVAGTFDRRHLVTGSLFKGNKWIPRVTTQDVGNQVLSPAARQFLRKASSESSDNSEEGIQMSQPFQMRPTYFLTLV
jgi:hypothetical protein